MDALEDSDGGVRDCARASVIEMFTAPTVTDGARADLKKEITKKGVRKGIVDSVLGQLFSSNAQNPEIAHEEPPPSSSSGFVPSRNPTISTLVSNAGPSRTVSTASMTTSELPEGKKAEGAEEAVAVYVSASTESHFISPHALRSPPRVIWSTNSRKCYRHSRAEKASITGSCGSVQSIESEA